MFAGGQSGRSDDWRRVKDASDIVRIVGEHVKLKPKGREYVGLCPFHDDHSPSMCVVPAKQLFHCFVCGAGGDVIAFIARFLRMENHEALKYLAERANIELTPWKPGGGQASGDEPAGPSRRDLLDAAAFAQEYFKALLRHPEHGAAGRAVVAKRGISAEMVETFGVGVSAARWDGLLLTLKAKGWAERPFVEAGLLKKRDSGDGAYDAFRNRLMFPIHDVGGRVIAFGGRKIDEADDPKYINSPETPLFSKSRTLYGLYQAWNEVRKLNQVVVTEGYTDTIACHQAGVRNVVATLGTALTRDHAAFLSRQCSRVVLLFDGDAAGQKAADRAVEVFFAEPIDVTICTLSAHTDAKDPDELLKREGGAEVLRRAFEASTDLLTYRFSRLRGTLAGAGVSALSKGIREEIDHLKGLGLAEVEPIKRRLVVRQLAGLAGLEERVIWDQIGGESGHRRVARAAGPEGGAQGTPGAGVTGGAGGAGGEGGAGADLARLSAGKFSPREAVLACILAEGTLYHALAEGEKDLVAPSAYPSALVAKVAEAVALVLDGGRPPGLHAVIDELSGEEAGEAAVSAATSLARRAEVESDNDGARLRAYFDACVKRAVSEGGDQGGAGEGLDLAARIELKRREHSALGGDRRRLPTYRGGRVDP